MRSWLWLSALCAGSLAYLIPATALLTLRIQDDVDRDCVWNRSSGNDPRCATAAYLKAGHYPLCALFKYASGMPVPCAGVRTLERADWCAFGVENRSRLFDNSQRPIPGSWHIHVFFPNPACPNCTAEYLHERENFTYAGAMEYRALISQQLNGITRQYGWDEELIDVVRASKDPNYNQCTDEFSIVAGAPANYHSTPCIFEVDDTKRLGPFTNPTSGLGYPNYSFLLPGDLWMPGVHAAMRESLFRLRRNPRFSQYAVLLHPNTGCEVRDHLENASILWMGDPHPLLATAFSCSALGCNQACPKHGTHVNPPAAC